MSHIKNIHPLRPGASLTLMQKRQLDALLTLALELIIPEDEK